MSSGLWGGSPGLYDGVSGLWSGVPGLWSGASGFVDGGGGAPALSLDFTTGVLDPRITFSRASLATMYDSTGKLTWCPNNLIPNGTAAAFTVDGATVNTGIADPFGGTAAWTVTAASGNMRVYQAVNRLGPSGCTGIWMRRRAGSGVVAISDFAGTSQAVAPTGTWQFLSTAKGVGVNDFFVCLFP